MIGESTRLGYRQEFVWDRRIVNAFVRALRMFHWTTEGDASHILTGWGGVGLWAYEHSMCEGAGVASHVLRTYVPVDDALRVEVLQAFADVAKVLSRLLNGQRPVPPRGVRGAHWPAHQLQHHVDGVLARVVDHLMEADDVRVAQFLKEGHWSEGGWAFERTAV